MKRKVDLPKKVWGYIDQCLDAGLYGETRDEVILSLMRTGGFDQAVKIGIIKLNEADPIWDSRARNTKIKFSRGSQT